MMKLKLMLPAGTFVRDAQMNRRDACAPLDGFAAARFYPDVDRRFTPVT